jgi:ubiquinone/menaquinone biosynthesis C-methylase UbiE
VTEPVRDRYAAAAGRLADTPLAQSSLGCGNPLTVADLHPGETVLDLGSGAGLDVLVSSRRVGPTGQAIGLDMTQEMLALARRHAAEQGVHNAEFQLGRIEDIPLPDNAVDVVISNCVITLSTDKPRVFAEIARVLRPGGRIGITDVIADFTLTDAERAVGADRVECLTSSLTTDQYVAQLSSAGLTDIQIQRTYEMRDKLHAAIVRAINPIRRSDSPVQVTPMHTEHAEQILAIYQAGLDTGDASFEITAPVWERWDAGHLPAHRFVATDPTGAVLGWVAASPVSGRCVYAGCSNTASTSIPTITAAASAGRCWRPTSPRRKLPECGPCNPGSSPRTSPASACTNKQASASSAAANESANTTAAGATSFSSNAAAQTSEAPHRTVLRTMALTDPAEVTARKKSAVPERTPHVLIAGTTNT